MNLSLLFIIPFIIIYFLYRFKTNKLINSYKKLEKMTDQYVDDLEYKQDLILSALKKYSQSTYSDKGVLATNTIQVIDQMNECEDCKINYGKCSC